MLPATFLSGLLGSTIFGLFSIVLLFLCFKIFDWITPQVDFQAALKSNAIAAAIVIAAFFLAVSHIISSLVH